jgi:hypothetical protein
MDKAPNGIWSSFPAFLAILAWILSISSSCVCTFVSRNVQKISSSLSSDEWNSIQVLQTRGVGFWGWQTKEGICYSYQINEMIPTTDMAFKMAAALPFLNSFLGGILTICLLLGTIFPIVPKSYLFIGLGSLFLFATNFATLVILRSNICSPDFFQFALRKSTPFLESISTSSCGIGFGSTLAILSGVLWILVSLLCLLTPLANSKREPGAYRGINHHVGGGNGEDGENFDGEPEDEMARLYRSKQAVNDERYRNLMGELDDVENPGFSSLAKKNHRLSLVHEEDNGDDTLITHPSTVTSEKDPRYQREYFHDEFHDDEDGDHSETRSQYSEEKYQFPDESRTSLNREFTDAPPHSHYDNSNLKDDSKLSWQDESETCSFHEESEARNHRNDEQSIHSDQSEDQQLSHGNTNYERRYENDDDQFNESDQHFDESQDNDDRNYNGYQDKKYDEGVDDGNHNKFEDRNDAINDDDDEEYKDYDDRKYDDYDDEVSNSDLDESYPQQSYHNNNDRPTYRDSEYT